MSTLAFSFELAQLFYGLSEPFPVDFDDAWVWLGYSRKDVAKRHLRNSGYKEDTAIAKIFA